MTRHVDRLRPLQAGTADPPARPGRRAWLQAGDAGIDGGQLFAQQGGHGGIRVGLLPHLGHAFANFSQREAELLGRAHVAHQFNGLRRIGAVTVGAPPRADQAARLVKAQAFTLYAGGGGQVADGEIIGMGGEGGRH